MKFSVAPELTSATALALFAIEWTKNRSVIDFHANKYTSPLLLCLISTDLIRQLENPHLFPFLLPEHLVLGPSCRLIAALPMLLYLGPGELVEYRWNCLHYSQGG